MCNRTFAASSIALLLIAWMFTPVEAGARGAGAFRGGAFKLGAHRFGFRHRRSAFGYALAYGGGGYGYDSPAVVINNQIPATRDANERPYQRVCRAEAHNVPSESGGVREVTVTRCFKE
jgi:hypothetical protein